MRRNQHFDLEGRGRQPALHAPALPPPRITHARLNIFTQSNPNALNLTVINCCHSATI